MTNKKTLTSILSVVAGLAVAFVSTPAHADGGLCTINNINTDWGGKFQIKCNEYANSFSVFPGQVCNTFTTSADTIKVYFSLAQSALLSGKKLRVTTNGTAPCTTYIMYMELDNN